MRIIKKLIHLAVLVAAITVIITVTPVSAKNYAVLISAGKTYWDDREYHSEYWYDLFLMYEALHENGFTHANIHVLYGDGSDFQSSYARYRVPSQWGISQITDRPNSKSNIQTVFSDLSSIMTVEDFLWVWWFGHGEIDGACPEIYFEIENTGELVYDHEFKNYVDQITSYKRRSFSIATCHSGGIIDDIENNKTVILTAVPCSALTQGELYDVYHNEFNYNLFCALDWETPSGEPINADYQPNGLVSMYEAFLHTIFYSTWRTDPQYSDPGNIGSNMYVFCAGHLVRNTHLSDDIDFTGDVIVDGGVTLTVDPGVAVRFTPGVDAELRVDGKLNAQGTSAERITFTSASPNPAAGNWQWIYFSDSSDDNSIISYANIEYAYDGIEISHASPRINYCNIQNNTSGIYASYCSSLIENNQITNNTAHGIYLYQSNPQITGNTIRYNGQQGIRCYRSSPEIHSNTISNNSQNGIFDYWYSSPLITSNYIRYNGYKGVNNQYYSSPNLGGRLSDPDPLPGNNEIDHNGQEGIYAYYNSDPFLGLYTGGNSAVGGWNWIESNNSFEAKATSYSDIKAEWNWWGAYPPNSSEFYKDGTSTIDYDPALYQRVHGSGGLAAQGGDLAMPSFATALDSAFWYQLMGDYDTAITMYDRIIHADPDTSSGKKALVRLEQCYRLSAKSGLLEYLSGISTAYPQKEIAGVAMELSLGLLVEMQNYSEAFSNLDKIREWFSSNSIMDANALFNTGYIYLKESHDTTKANAAFEELKMKYPNDPLVSDITLLLHGPWSGGSEQQFAKQSSRNEVKVTSEPRDFAVFQNYPNPSNPTTLIRFQLPTDCEVVMTLYNVLGYKVRQLVHENKVAGTHYAMWDGKNDRGETVPSGVYLYRTEARVSGQVRFSDTRRLVLLR